MAKTAIGLVATRRIVEVIGRHDPSKSVLSSVITTAKGTQQRELSPMSYDIDGRERELPTLLGNHQVAVSLGAIEAMRVADEDGVTELVLKTTSDRLGKHDRKTWTEEEEFLRSLNWAIRKVGTDSFDLFDIVKI